MFDSAKLMYSTGADFYEHPIEQSLRFNDDDSAYLSRTFGTPTSQYTWTFSCWVKPSTFTDICLFEAYAGNNDSDYFVFHLNGSSKISIAGFNTAWRQTNALFRDPSAWYHLVLSVDTTQATAADRIKLYINGVEETSFSTSNNPSQNSRIGINNPSATHHIGVDTYGGLYKKMNGYLSEVHFIDGTALDADSFGKTKSGVWIPKRYSGSYGTNGFYLPFAGGSPSVTGGNFAQTTYTGTGASQNINVGFKPDLIWTKVTSKSDQHVFTDSVRGVNSQLYLDLANSAGSGTTVVTSINNDGFTVGSSVAANQSGENYIAMCWSAGGGSGSSNTDGSITSTVQASNGFSVCNYTGNSDGFQIGSNNDVNYSGRTFASWSWKAGGSGVSNTDGSITSTVSANTDAGFSIVSYTGNEVAGDTVGHGLSSAPEMLIIKRRNAIENWQIYHHAIASDAETDYLEFTTAAASDNANRWNDTAPTSSVVTLGTHAGLNHNGSTYVMYAFHSVEGYSKFGSYSSNSDTNGPFIYCGFKPAMVIVKRATDTQDWVIYDNKRDVDNEVRQRLFPNTRGAESDYNGMDFLSNGFKIRINSSQLNYNADYIFMAFAENPFKYSTAR